MKPEHIYYLKLRALGVPAKHACRMMREARKARDYRRVWFPIQVRVDFDSVGNPLLPKVYQLLRGHSSPVNCIHLRLNELQPSPRAVRWLPIGRGEILARRTFKTAAEAFRQTDAVTAKKVIL
jgi:hypothetical protein